MAQGGGASCRRACHADDGLPMPFPDAAGPQDRNQRRGNGCVELRRAHRHGDRAGVRAGARADAG
eukprot:6912422-Lingulodinium_polyedra.AAC.1